MRFSVLAPCEQVVSDDKCTCVGIIVDRGTVSCPMPCSFVLVCKTLRHSRLRLSVSERYEEAALPSCGRFRQKASALSRSLVRL